MSVPIGAGSDAGSPLTSHGSLIEDLFGPGERRVTPLEGLRCAPDGAAQILSLGDEVGSIEPGKVADLILVPDDPLEDLSSLRNVRNVWKEGRLAYRADAEDA